MNKNILLLLFFTILSSAVIAQGEKPSNNENSWQLGIGLAVTKFSESDAAYIGDKNLVQIPRLNLTMPISNRLSVDGALSFNTTDLVIKNSVKYLSMDGSLRYNFDNLFENFYPYLFAGGSLVDSERKMTPTLNFGGGATYWVTDKIGLNTQVYYKHSFDGYESMRSHIQITAGLVYKLKWRRSFKRSSGGVVGSGSSCYYDQHKL